MIIWKPLKNNNTNGNYESIMWKLLKDIIWKLYKDNLETMKGQYRKYERKIQKL